MISRVDRMVLKDVALVALVCAVGLTFLFTALVLVSILIGGLIEIVPTVIHKDFGTRAVSAAKPEMVATPSKYLQVPYTPLQLEGRDLYVREGCYVCHSQMVRPFRHETLRYGEYSRAESYVYDHPYQWGSKRTGPDLHRLSGRYPNLWHFQHLKDPRSTSPGSIMPSYGWLAEQTLDFAHTASKLEVMKTLGVPYDAETIADAKELALAEARLIAQDLEKTGAVKIAPEAEIVALIAYLQQLGLLHEAPPLAQASQAAPAAPPSGVTPPAGNATEVK